MADLIEALTTALPTLNKLVFSQPVEKGSERNISFRGLDSKKGRIFQTETIQDNKAFHRNFTPEELLVYCGESCVGKYRQVLIAGAAETSQYVLGTKGYKRTSHTAAKSQSVSHNREKSYILEEGEEIPALVDLGIFTPDYKLIRAKSDKLRQINRFVELVDHGFRDYNRPDITILDFGCGKSYLTFILYYYFAVKRGLETTIIGYDLKEDVVQHCNEVAQKYGYDRLKFIRADVVKDVLYDAHIDMVVTLHACDIATDYALRYAIEHKATKIFSVPCCQHEVNNQISPGGDLDILLRYGIVKERVSALLTDSIRAAVLEDMGYRVDMIEFVDFEHSPKNLMLRASYTGRLGRKNIAAAEKLSESYQFKQTLLEYALGTVK